MVEILQGLRPSLEVAYFVSGIVVAVAAIYGLQQVRLMKRDIQIRSERAAREKAIEYVTRYFSQYVPLDAACYADEQKNGVLPYRGPISDFSPESLPAKLLPNARKRLALNSCLPALNELHTIAAAFAFGVADDKVGFQALGRTFCHTVASRYDILCLVRDDPACQYYEGIVLLYNMWAPRLSKSELGAVRTAIDREIASLGGRNDIIEENVQ